MNFFILVKLGEILKTGFFKGGEGALLSIDYVCWHHATQSDTVNGSEQWQGKIELVLHGETHV